MRIVGEGGRATGVVFQRTELDEPATRTGPVRGDSGLRVHARRRHGGEGARPGAPARPGRGPARLAIDERGRSSSTAPPVTTSVPRLFAGGDCLRSGGEVVDAVQDGKIAARGIHATLTAR